MRFIQDDPCKRVIGDVYKRVQRMMTYVAIRLETHECDPVS